MASPERLRERAAQLAARAAAAEARARDAERRRRTHAAIVAGSLLLDRPEVLGLDATAVRAALDLVVQRDHDRRALGLPPLADAAPGVTDDVG